jgi:photosystem II stability/assembly factor-like uncharacterized protein
MHVRHLLAALCCVAAGAAAADIDPALLAGFKVRSIGPAGMSGRIAAIEAVPGDPETVYAGAATGGVWKSVNGGLTWQPVFDDQPVHAIGAIAVHPANPGTVWVGTGEGNVRNSASVGSGVYRSSDGGRTWSHLGLEASERIPRIVLHPTDENVAWVAALGREWGENPERGVYKTTDGGRTSTRVLYVDPRTGAADLAIDPANPNRLFAAMWQYRRWPYFFRSGGPGSGLFSSSDGGSNWKRLTEKDGLPAGDLGRIGVAFCHSHPEVVYALVEAEKSALLRSADGGVSWQKVNETPNVAPRPFYYADLRVDPVWPNRVYSLDYVIRVSDDGGKRFSVLPGADWRLIHGDYHAMWIDPTNPDHLYVGNDGGVAVSDDRGKTARFVANLPLAQYYHIAVDSAEPYHVLGGMQDNGNWRGPAAVWAKGGIRNHEWRLVGDGDGYDVRAHPVDPEIGYSMWQGGNLMRWNLRTGEIRDIKPPRPEGPKLRFNWNAGFAQDPFEPDTIYLGSQFVHRSTDRGESWTVISPDLSGNNPAWLRQDDSGGLTPDVTAAENHCTILSIAPSPVQRGMIWIGTDDGRLHVSRDGGASWTSVEANLKGVPANTWIPHIEPSHFDAGTAFVVFDDHRRSNFAAYVARTTDFGRTWTSMATPQLRGWALVVVQDPVDSELLFLGTEFGLWASIDGGRRWLPFNHGLPTASVMDLAIHPREHDLVIGTHGRAAYVLDDLRPLRTLTAELLAHPLHLFEPTGVRQHWLAAEAGGFGLGSGEFRGENRPYGAILSYSLNVPDLPHPDSETERAERETVREAASATATWGPEPPPKPTATPTPAVPASEAPQVEIRVADSGGTMIRTFKAPARRGVNRAVWDLRRDPFKQPPRDEPAVWEEPPVGPEVPPGSYTVTVAFGEHSASAPVEVLPDPRSANSAADWQRRAQAIAAAGALRDGAVGAIERLGTTRRDVEAVLLRVRQGAADKATAEKDPLVVAGTALLNELATLDRKLWTAPSTVGIVAENDAFSKVTTAERYLQSSWSPPSPSHEAYLAEARTALEGVMTEINAFDAGQVAAFRRLVAERAIRLLPEAEPLKLSPP